MNIHLNTEQLPDGEEEPALQGCKGDDSTDAEAKRIAYNLRTRDEINNRWCDRKEDADEHEKPTPDHLLAYFQVGQGLILLLKPILGIFLAPKSFC